MMEEDKKQAQKPLGLKKTSQKKKESVSLKETESQDEIYVQTEGDDLADAINLVETAETLNDGKILKFDIIISHLCVILIRCFSKAQRKKELLSGAIHEFDAILRRHYDAKYPAESTEETTKDLDLSFHFYYAKAFYLLAEECRSFNFLQAAQGRIEIALEMDPTDLSCLSLRRDCLNEQVSICMIEHFLLLWCLISMSGEDTTSFYDDQTFNDVYLDTFRTQFTSRKSILVSIRI
jgi:hypothetical protein